MLRYLFEVPADHVPIALRQLRPRGDVRFITVSLEYGRGFSGPGHFDVFNPNKLRGGDLNDERGPGVRTLRVFHALCMYSVGQTDAVLTHWHYHPDCFVALCI